MENGGPNAKKNADLVTDAVMDNGLYHAFEKLSLI
ncbi:hypothetical protein [Lactobacillus jensenii]|nr:hypothetical protein [Lactobacillus jensenii]